MQLKDRTGHSTMPVTDDGTPTGKLLGIVTSRDYRPSRDDHSKLVSEFMTPRAELIVGDKDITLKDANDLIWDKKLNARRRRQRPSGRHRLPQGLRLPQDQPQRAARCQQALHGRRGHQHP